MAVLVIAEHDKKTLKRATLQAVDAAARLGEVHLLVLGSGVDAVAQAAAKVAGVAQVKVVDDPALAEPLAEVVTAQVVPLAKDYSHVVAAATAHGKDFMPRVAALLDVAQISEVTGIDSADTFRRPIYAGNAIATVQSSDPIKVLTVRGTSFDEAAAEGGSAAIEKVAAVAVDGQPALVGREQASSDRPAEQFQSVLEPLADRLGAALGASRAAVDAGYAPNDWQVGQTGKIVAPQLYIAAGISGAIQHLAGMKDSRIIVAINTDEEAPIFSVADYGLVADLFEAVPALTAKLG